MANPKSKALQFFRDRVRKLIAARNLAVKDIAEAAGLTREHLSRILNSDKHDCNIGTCEKIAEALDVSLIELITPEKTSKKSA